MLTIKCSHCKHKIFKYRKVGKGRVLKCCKSRIHRDYSVKSNDEIRCVCGNVIGIDEGKWIKMKQSAFIFSGTYS